MAKPVKELPVSTNSKSCKAARALREYRPKSRQHPFMLDEREITTYRYANFICARNQAAD